MTINNVRGFSEPLPRIGDDGATYANRADSFMSEFPAVLTDWNRLKNEVMQYSQNFVLGTTSASYAPMASGGLVPFLTTGGEITWFFAIPKFQIQDLRPDGALGTGTHPAFIHNSGEYDVLYVAAYMASMSGTEIVSQPNVQPRHSRTQAEEIAECAATDIAGIPSGSHRLMSIWDRSAVNMWIAANIAAGSSEPIGNTSWGKSHELPHICGTGSSRTNTGTMGDLANHNQRNAGIADWVGNCWERLHGMHIQDGEIFLAANNDPFSIASPVTENHWFNGSSSSANGTPSIVTSSAGIVRNGAVGDDSHGSYDYIAGAGGFASISGSSSQRLKLSGVAPVSDSTNLKGAIYARNYGHRTPIVGGSWSYGASAGAAALDLYSAASNRSSRIGFRSAFAV